MGGGKELADERIVPIFLAGNALFLIATALWFRTSHSVHRGRFNRLPKEALIDEVQWQYSLRSNLLLFGSAMMVYLIYIRENQFLMRLLVVFSVVNVATDSVYSYERATIFRKVKRGHRIAAFVVITTSIIYELKQK